MKNLALVETPANGPADIAPQNPLLVPAIDITGGNLPDLATAEAAPLDLVSEYYTPEKHGDKLRCFFLKMGTATATDQQSGEEFDLPCAFFAVRGDDGKARVVRNGSRQLVGTIQDAIKQGIIRPGTPLELTFLGKKRNKSNQNFHDAWSVVPLRITL